MKTGKEESWTYAAMCYLEKSSGNVYKFKEFFSKFTKETLRIESNARLKRAQFSELFVEAVVICIIMQVL